MIVHNCEQRSTEWHRFRTTCFTASEFGPYCLNPVSVQLTKDEISAKLDELSIAHKRSAKRDDLLELLPDAEQYATVTQGAMTAILKKIQQGKINRIARKNPSEWTEYEGMMIALYDQIEEQKTRQMDFNIAVQRGIQLEPHAREEYERLTGFKVEQPGFIEHDSRGFACSPDGMISETPFSSSYSHGIEIKCPLPETHMAYLLNGTLPDEYIYQVHGSMAVTGLDRWDFFSYCPGEAPLLLQIQRDDFTNDLAAGLQTLVLEKAKIEKRLAEIWRNSFNADVMARGDNAIPTDPQPQ